MNLLKWLFCVKGQVFRWRSVRLGLRYAWDMRTSVGRQSGCATTTTTTTTTRVLTLSWYQNRLNRDGTFFLFFFIRSGSIACLRGCHTPSTAFRLLQRKDVVNQCTHIHTLTYSLTESFYFFSLAQLPSLFQHEFKWKMKVPNINESKTLVTSMS